MDVPRRKAPRRSDRQGSRVLRARQAAFDVSTGHQAGGARAHLAGVVEAQVVPRLVLAHRSPWQPAEAARPLDEDSVQDFTETVLAGNLELASRHVAGMGVRGVPLESVYLELLAPSARLLGQMWIEDRCDFTAVTLATWRLHQLMRDMSPAFIGGGVPRTRERRILLCPAPGEQHSFGLAMVADFFRRGGWDVWSAPSGNARELSGIVSADWFAVIGLSAGCENHLDGLASTIHSLRRTSRNRAVGIMVGGAAFDQRPELVGLLGADASARDGRHAVAQAEGLLPLATRRR
jgi:methanogenic corrinoid protein MtbC1